MSSKRTYPDEAIMYAKLHGYSAASEKYGIPKTSLYNHMNPDKKRLDNAKQSQRKRRLMKQVTENIREVKDLLNSSSIPHEAPDGKSTVNVSISCPDGRNFQVTEHVEDVDRFRKKLITLLYDC